MWMEFVANSLNECMRFDNLNITDSFEYSLCLYINTNLIFIDNTMVSVFGIIASSIFFNL